MIRLPLVGLVALSSALVGADLTAQGANLGFSRKPSPSWIIINSFSSVPGSDMRQVHHAKLSNNPDGQWTTALTVTDIPAQVIDCTGSIVNTGGVLGTQGILIGRFDPYNGTFCVTNEAENLNSAANERHVMLSPDGKDVIFERDTGVFIATRGGAGQQFGTPVQVAAFTAGQRYYPALAPVDGVMNVFYTDGNNIVRDTINLGAATVGGSPVTVSGPAQAGAFPISPTPLIGADGNAEALWMADEVSPRTAPFVGDADPVIAGDLDPSTPALVQVNRTDYQCCGGFAGGFTYFSHDINPAWHLMHSETANLIGDTEPIGGQADLLATGVNFNAPSPLFALHFGAASTVPAFSLTGFAGKVGLDPASVIQLGTSSTTTKDGSSVLSFPIPNDPSLSGLNLPIQAVVTDLTNYTLSNTAALVIQ